MVEVGLNLYHQFLQVSAVLLLDTALVDYRVQRISHFVRDGRVYQWRKVTLSIHVVIENFWGDVDKLEDKLLGSLLTFFDCSLNLEVHKSWEIFFRCIDQAGRPRDGISDLSVALVLDNPIGLLSESKNFLAYLVLREIYDVL